MQVKIRPVTDAPNAPIAVVRARRVPGNGVTLSVGTNLDGRGLLRAQEWAAARGHVVVSTS